MRLKTPDFAAYRKALNNVQQSRIHQRGANSSELQTSGQAIVAEFTRAHFLEIAGILDRSGNPLSPEKQRAFIDSVSPVAELAGLATLGCVNRPAEDIQTDQTSGALVWEDESDSVEIETEVWLADFDKLTEVSVPILHVLRQPSESDRVSYNKLSKTRTRTENKVEITWTTANYESMQKLYGNLVLALHGALIDGSECNESNKSAWTARVPLPWIAFVLSETFIRISAKNGCSFAGWKVAQKQKVCEGKLKLNVLMKWILKRCIQIWEMLTRKKSSANLAKLIQNSIANF